MILTSCSGIDIPKDRFLAVRSGCTTCRQGSRRGVETPGLKFLSYFVLGLVIPFLAPLSAQAQPDLDNTIQQRRMQVETDRAKEDRLSRQDMVRELKDDRARSYVGDVVGRILRQTGLKNQEKVTYQVLDWDVVNAFVTPDLKVYVTTGLLELIESDDELACILGHELGHIKANHLRGRTKQALIWQGLTGLALALGQGKGGVIGSQMLGNLAMLRYGRKQELEADMCGLKFARDAGYDASGMVHFLRKMGARDGKMDDPLTVMMSTHPPAPQRITQAQKFVKAEGLEESRLLRLSFNVKTDRQVVDLTHGISGSAPLSPAATANLLSNGRLQKKKTGLAGWNTANAGVLTQLKSGGAILKTTGDDVFLEADPVKVEPNTGYLLRCSYRALTPAHVRLTARFEDGAGKRLSEVEVEQKPKKDQYGILSLDVAPGKAIPASAGRIVLALALLESESAAVEFRSASVERAPAPPMFTEGPVAGNLIPNGSFETMDAGGKLPVSWKVVRGNAALDSRIKSAGSVSLRLKAANAKEWAEVHSDLIAVNPHVDHLLSGWLRTKKGNSRMSLGLRFFRKDKGFISSTLVAAQGVFPPDEFTRYAGIVFAAGDRSVFPPDTAFVAIVGTSGYYTQDPCWFDDIALIRVQKP
jgi:Zn-dependent protease with chaperone function